VDSGKRDVEDCFRAGLLADGWIARHLARVLSGDIAGNRTLTAGERLANYVACHKKHQIEFIEKREFTMTVLHSGSTGKYSDNWESAFGKPKKKRVATKKKATSKKAGAAKKSTKKKTAAAKKSTKKKTAAKKSPAKKSAKKRATKKKS